MQQTFKKYQQLQPTQPSDIICDLSHKFMAVSCAEGVVKCSKPPICLPSPPPLPPPPRSEIITKIIRADWNATSGEGLILNKPDLSIYATIEYVDEKISHIPSGGGGVAVQSDWEEEDETSYAYILNKPELHEAMTNGEIENLLN